MQVIFPQKSDGNTGMETIQLRDFMYKRSSNSLLGMSMSSTETHVQEMSYYEAAKNRTCQFSLFYVVLDRLTD